MRNGPRRLRNLNLAVDNRRETFIRPHGDAFHHGDRWWVDVPNLYQYRHGIGYFSGDWCAVTVDERRFGISDRNVHRYRVCDQRPAAKIRELRVSVVDSQYRNAVASGPSSD